MTLIIAPSIQKVKPQDIETFLATENTKTIRKLKTENTRREIDKKNALDIYRTLCRPLNDQALSAIVKNTGLQLRDVI